MLRPVVGGFLRLCWQWCSWAVVVSLVSGTWTEAFVEVAVVAVVVVGVVGRMVLGLFPPVVELRVVMKGVIASATTDINININTNMVLTPTSTLTSKVSTSTT